MKRKPIAASPAPEITWDDAVLEGKRLVAEADKNHWKLAELADAVATQYNEDSLGKFAAEIGIAACMIQRRRTTYRHWKEFAKSDPGRFSRLPYSVARELEKHPDKEKLIKENPTMSKRQAAALMKARRNPESETQRIQQYLKQLLVRTAKARTDVGLLKLDRQILRVQVDSNLLNELREGGRAWINLAAALKKEFLNRPADKASPAKEKVLVAV
jgi:hypothetical protein